MRFLTIFLLMITLIFSLSGTSGAYTQIRTRVHQDMVYTGTVVKDGVVYQSYKPETHIEIKRIDQPDEFFHLIDFISQFLRFTYI